MRTKRETGQCVAPFPGEERRQRNDEESVGVVRISGPLPDERRDDVRVQPSERDRPAGSRPPQPRPPDANRTRRVRASATGSMSGSTWTVVSPLASVVGGSPTAAAQSRDQAGEAGPDAAAWTRVPGVRRHPPRPKFEAGIRARPVLSRNPNRHAACSIPSRPAKTRMSPRWVISSAAISSRSPCECRAARQAGVLRKAQPVHIVRGRVAGRNVSGPIDRVKVDRCHLRADPALPAECPRAR